MTKLITLLALSLTACVGIQSALGHPPCDPSGNATPAVSEAQLRAAWEARFGKLPERCNAPWSWSIISEDDLARTCGQTRNVAGEWKDANACTVFGIGDNGTSDPGCPATFTWPKYAQSKELNTHEIAHWYLWCSRHDSDFSHTHFPEVWSSYDGSFGQ